MHQIVSPEIADIAVSSPMVGISSDVHPVLSNDQELFEEAHNTRVQALLHTDSPVDVQAPDFITTAQATLRVIATERAKVTRNEGLISKYSSLVEQGGTTKRYEKQVATLGRFIAKRETYSPIALLSDEYYARRDRSLEAYRRKDLTPTEKQSALLDTLEAFDRLQEATGFAKDEQSFKASREYLLLQHEAPKTLRVVKKLSQLALKYAVHQDTSQTEVQMPETIPAVVTEPVEAEIEADTTSTSTPLIDTVGYTQSYKQLFEGKRRVTDQDILNIRENAREMTKLLSAYVETNQMTVHGTSLRIHDLQVLRDIARKYPIVAWGIIKGHDESTLLESTDPNVHNLRKTSLSIDRTQVPYIPKYIRRAMEHLPRGGGFMLRRHLEKQLRLRDEVDDNA